MSVRLHYRALCDKVDAFFARVATRHGDELACRSGCDGCCRVRLSVTPIEAEAIVEHLATLPAPRRAELAARAGDLDRCVALDGDGRCAIYPARPLVCRSHGLPIRLRDGRGLPVVQACELNFVAHGPAAADPDCILDQTTLSTTLAALDAAHARESGDTPGRRVELATLLDQADM